MEPVPAALYEEAVRRSEGLIAADGPLVCRTGPAHRPLAERQVHRQRAVERAAHRLGRSNRPMDAGALRRCCSATCSRRSRARSCSSRTAMPAPIPRTGCRSASSPSTPGTACSRATCSSSIRRPRPRRTPQFTIIDAPSFKADPARHGTRSEVVIALNFAKRLVLIGGTATPARSRSRSSAC